MKKEDPKNNRLAFEGVDSNEADSIRCCPLEIAVIDFNHLTDEALLRSLEFLKPSGPVPAGRTKWLELVAAGKAPQPVIRTGRLTAWRWGDIREYLISLANGEGA